jgi:hypothetical protein
VRAIAPGEGDLAERCVLAIRPENVAITPAAATAAGAGGSASAAANGDGLNRVAGRVTLRSYLGNTLRYDVAVQGGALKADVRDPWHHEPLELGAPVALAFPPSVTLAVADDA